MIQAFLVLDYLRQRFPHAQIDWVAEKSVVDLLSAHPSLSHVLSVDFKHWRKAPFSTHTLRAAHACYKQLRKTQYDLLFDLQGNGKSALVTACAKAKVKVGFGFRSAREKTNLLATHVRFNVPEAPIRSKYLQLVQDYFKDTEKTEPQCVRLTLNAQENNRLNALLAVKKAPWLMIAPHSKWANKQLDQETLGRLLTSIAARFPFSFLFIYGNEEEKRIADALASHFPERSLSIGNLTLPLWQALMYVSHGVLAVDSAALHLCATTPTPSFSVFGPSIASVFKPAGERHAAIQGSCPYGKTFVKQCPLLRTCPTGACLKNLSADALFERFCSWANNF